MPPAAFPRVRSGKELHSPSGRRGEPKALSRRYRSSGSRPGCRRASNRYTGPLYDSAEVLDAFLLLCDDANFRRDVLVDLAEFHWGAGRGRGGGKEGSLVKGGWTRRHHWWTTPVKRR